MCAEKIDHESTQLKLVALASNVSYVSNVAAVQ